MLYLFIIGYEETKGLAIIQDFTAHCAIKNEQMVNVWNFTKESKSKSESKQLECGSRRFSFNFDIGSNFQTFAICSFFISQWAVKSRIISRPLVFSDPYK